MPVSTHNPVTGTVNILVDLLDDNLEPASLVAVVETWVRLVNAGFFATGRVPKNDVTASNRGTSGTLTCEAVPRVAFDVLAQMVERPPGQKTPVASAALRGIDSRPFGKPGGQALVLPESFPFEVEQPEDLRSMLRVEIEFRHPLSKPDQQTVFAAFADWDMMVEALGKPQGPDATFDAGSCLMSPAIVEHEVFEYWPSYECLDYIIFMGLRLHNVLAIDRLTVE